MIPSRVKDLSVYSYMVKCDNQMNYCELALVHLNIKKNTDFAPLTVDHIELHREKQRKIKVIIMKTVVVIISLVIIYGNMS